MSEGTNPSLLALCKAMPDGFYAKLIEVLERLNKTHPHADLYQLHAMNWRIEFHRLRPLTCPTCGREDG